MPDPDSATSVADQDLFRQADSTMEAARAPVRHHVIHDLESQWWLAIWICNNYVISDDWARGPAGEQWSLLKQKGEIQRIFPLAMPFGDVRKDFLEASTPEDQQSALVLQSRLLPVTKFLHLIRHKLVQLHRSVGRRVPRQNTVTKKAVESRCTEKTFKFIRKRYARIRKRCQSDKLLRGELMRIDHLRTSETSAVQKRSLEAVDEVGGVDGRQSDEDEDGGRPLGKQKKRRIDA